MTLPHGELPAVRAGQLLQASWLRTEGLTKLGKSKRSLREGFLSQRGYRTRIRAAEVGCGKIGIRSSSDVHGSRPMLDTSKLRAGGGQYPRFRVSRKNASHALPCSAGGKWNDRRKRAEAALGLAHGAPAILPAMCGSERAQVLHAAGDLALPGLRLPLPARARSRRAASRPLRS